MKRVKGEGVWFSDKEYIMIRAVWIGFFVAMIGALICLVYLQILEARRPIPAVYENGEATAYYVEIDRETADGIKTYGGWLPLLESAEEAEQVRSNGPQFAVRKP